MNWLNDLEAQKRRKERREKEAERKREQLLAEEERKEAQETAKKKAIEEELTRRHRASPALALIQQLLGEMKTALGVDFYMDGDFFNREVKKKLYPPSKWTVEAKGKRYIFQVEHLHPVRKFYWSLSLREAEKLLREKEFVVVRYGGSARYISDAREEKKIEVGGRSWEKKLRELLRKAYSDPMYEEPTPEIRPDDPYWRM